MPKKEKSEKIDLIYLKADERDSGCYFALDDEGKVIVDQFLITRCFLCRYGLKKYFDFRAKKRMSIVLYDKPGPDRLRVKPMDEAEYLFPRVRIEGGEVERVYQLFGERLHEFRGGKPVYVELWP